MSDLLSVISIKGKSQTSDDFNLFGEEVSEGKFVSSKTALLGFAYDTIMEY